MATFNGTTIEFSLKKGGAMLKKNIFDLKYIIRKSLTLLFSNVNFDRIAEKILIDNVEKNLSFDSHKNISD